MDNSPSENSTVSAVDDPNGEAALGGADAVNDTPSIAAHGTTPGSPFRVVTPTEGAPGSNKLVWLAVIVAVGLILAYAAGMLR
ncbi:MAG: hypothetical protein ABR585_02600 [Gemmatimonadaceae bacterium]